MKVLEIFRKLAPTYRARMYAVLLALLPIGAAWGLISKEDIPLYIALIGAMLGSTVAYANRPTVENKPTVTEAPSVILQAELDARSSAQ